MFKHNSAIAALFLVYSASFISPDAIADEGGSTIKLTGAVEKFDTSGFSAQISKLTDAALERNDEYKEADRLVKRFSTKAHKTKVATKELINAMIPYRGFAPSREGSQIWLEKIKKIKSLQCAEYFKQRVADEMHTKTIGTVLQIALGLDTDDKEKSNAMVNEGMAELKQLVGDDESKRMLQVMKSWHQDIQVPERVFDKGTWDVTTLQKNIRNATAYSFQHDPLMGDVVAKLKKHDRGKLMMALGTGVQVSTAVATLLSPGMFAPIVSEFINASFTTGTGGAEATKMLHQMYYGRRLESRWKRINEESQLALTSYQRALQTKSPTLLACAESVMQHLVGRDDATKLIGELVVSNPDPKVSPIKVELGLSHADTKDESEKLNAAKIDEFESKSKLTIGHHRGPGRSRMIDERDADNIQLDKLLHN